MLMLKRTYESPPVGPWSDYDYDVLDGDQRVGRIVLAQQTPEGRRWFWTTARVPQSTDDHGYAASREQAMADFEVRWGALHPRRIPQILVQPIDLASKVYDRTPVLLQPKVFDGSLAGTAGTELLKPAPNDYLQTWPVSKQVNSSHAPGDDPTPIERGAA
jgi:hypothetical protein